ncbi:gap junction delta-4 protein-like [Dunckerocampus dactyliophorus]|uniref:gap junction delta-4 protein-like n=1 Tax=Dunckerocampus dactyliophorus TaxID=161453 RepID=UPI0024076561|nr:gap junction delta-4 protein-like [Dunckerocampus dactyliophorus]
MGTLYDLVFITISHNVSFIGKSWWVLMVLGRVLLLCLAALSLFGDEQERFACNSLQPGCSVVCFDVLSPVSLLRLWLFQLILVCLPNIMFATYVTHKITPRYGALHCNPSGGVPRFYCSYIVTIILRILLEVSFGAGQFFLFGLSIPKSMLCYEAPCSSGVECYISRPTEKTLMLHLMLALDSLSAMWSLLDLAGTMKAMLTWRRKKRMLRDELSKGEQSSVLTASAADTDGLLTQRTSPSGISKNDHKEEPSHSNGQLQKLQDCGDAKTDESAFSVMHFVLHDHVRPPVLPCFEPGSRPPTPNKLGRVKSKNNSSPTDKRAWV